MIGRPSYCDDCGTPLDRVRETDDSYQQFLPLLLPGLSHLWRGYLLRGTIALFGSFAALLWLLAELQRMDWSSGTVIALSLWTIVWTAWSLGWHWNRLGLTARRPSVGRIVSTVLVLLALSNVAMLILVIGIFTGTRI